MHSSSPVDIVTLASSLPLMVDTTCVFEINSLCGLTKAYKSIIKRWLRRSKKSSSSSSRSENNNKQQRQNQTQQQEGTNMNGIHSFSLNGDPLREDPLMMGSRSGSGCSLYRHRSLDNSYFPSKVGNSSMSSNTIRKVNNNNHHHHHTRSKSRESCDFMPTPSSCYSSGSFRMNPHIQSTNASGRRSGTPIMYSSSSGMLKPPPIEKKLECTLEELCYGCKKKVKITRDVLTDTGGIVQEEEILTINVQPGWTKGTKITFEGKGNERAGAAYREDIVFFISEKRHQLFRREGDDLELRVEIPLVKALTGCTISVPLLGGMDMSLTLEDIIYPGYEKMVIGQGMPISREPGKRGDLRVTFLVEFPTRLTDNQRSEVYGILQDSCYY